MNKIDKILTHFGDALCKNDVFSFLFIARGVQLDNRVNPPRLFLSFSLYIMARLLCPCLWLVGWFNH